MGAASGGGDGRDEFIADINVTPLVDIVLVLLIIFLVTSPFIFQPAIPIELPSAKTTESGGETEMGILIGPQGEYALNGQPATQAEIVARIGEVLNEGKEPVVLISADKRVAHGVVVNVLDFVREAGVARFAINVEPAR